ncbi:MAG TPA: zinc ribbon domain-containing protein [Pyrinomonadaceae bacterium]|jgi:hypothetical protein
MQSPQNLSECPVCHAPLEAGSSFCSRCGAPRPDGDGAELRAVLYLLSELERWQEEATISPAQAAALRIRYERRRDHLRARLAESAEPEASVRDAAQPPQKPSQLPSTEQPSKAAPSSIRFPLAQPTAPQPEAEPVRQRRNLVETLAEPYTLRLLLYTGAAMFVVGIIIWLRDVLYLKLQEPVVQAALLMLATIALSVSGWLTILRTRQRLTGRALTLAGSLLVPVNFWFLVRSGLIANHGRAWVVCAFCTLLYAYTAALLREKLYAYLAAAASLATGWSLVYRAERDASGLYALVLLGASLLFLHLSRLFPRSVDESKAVEDEAAEGPLASATGRWSRELWSGPLTHSALAGASLCALLYMPLRLGPSLTLYDGVINPRARLYDPGTAVLIFAGFAYTAWFAGRYAYTAWRRTLYALCALALLWAQFLMMDGLHLAGSTQVLLLAASVLGLSFGARRARNVEVARALYRASVFAGLMLLPVAFAVLLGPAALTLRESAGFTLLAAAFASLSARSLSGSGAQKAFAYLAAALATAAFLLALADASLSSVTLNTAACAAWPFALYAAASAARRKQLETQLTAPFERTASAEFVLLLLWASVVSLALHVSDGQAFGVPRAALFCALFAPLLYGVLRARLDGDAFGAGLATIASLVAVASSLDDLRARGVWPPGWPIAAGVVCAAFVLHKAGMAWLHERGAADGARDRRVDEAVRLATDGAVVLCALLWFLNSLALFERGRYGGPLVLLVALLYWAERAASKRLAWPVYLTAAHLFAFFVALLIALNIAHQWFAALAAFVLVPVFFVVGAQGRGRQADWLAVPARNAGVISMGLACMGALLEALPHLRAGDSALLAPAVAFVGLACVSFIVSALSGGRERVEYFRAGLYLSVVAYALVCLRAGFEPLTDVEVYTSPVSVLLLAVAYVSYRREWDDYARDTSLLFWTGSILLGGPLLLRALQFRLLLDLPAPARDLATLCASLALLVFGVLGRLRAPVIVGAVTLLIELLALTLTSVDWLQVPLKIYLVTVGALLAVVGWMFEYRREQLILIRNRLNARREAASERFGAWR